MGGPPPGVRRDMGSGVMEISRNRREHKERHCHFMGPKIQGVDNTGRNCRNFRPPAKAGRRSAGGRVADVATHRPHLRFVTSAGPVLRRPAALRHSQKRGVNSSGRIAEFRFISLGAWGVCRHRGPRRRGRPGRRIHVRFCLQLGPISMVFPDDATAKVPGEMRDSRRRSLYRHRGWGMRPRRILIPTESAISPEIPPI